MSGSDFYLGKFVGHQEKITFDNIASIINNGSKQKLSKEKTNAVKALKNEVSQLVADLDSAKALEQTRFRQIKILQELFKDAAPEKAKEAIKKINDASSDIYKEELIKINPEYKKQL